MAVRDASGQWHASFEWKRFHFGGGGLKCTRIAMQSVCLHRQICRKAVHSDYIENNVRIKTIYRYDRWHALSCTGLKVKGARF